MKRINTILIIMIVICFLVSGCAALNRSSKNNENNEMNQGNTESIELTAVPDPTLAVSPSPSASAEATAAPTPEPTPTPIPSIEIQGQLSDVVLIQGETTSFSITANNYLEAKWILRSPDGVEIEAVKAEETVAGLSSEITDGTTLVLKNVPAELNMWIVFCRYIGLNGTDEAETNEAAISVRSWLDLYEPVFVNYRTTANSDINTFDHSLDTYGVLGSYDLTLWQDVTYGFVLKDLDGNGIPELIVGNMASPEDNIIHAMFTLVDYQPHTVLCSWTRNIYYLSSRGGLYHHGSNGAMNSDTYICSYSGTTVTPLYGCFTSDGANYGFYKVSNGDRYSGEAVPVSQEEFIAYQESLAASIVPLNDLSLIWIF